MPKIKKALKKAGRSTKKALKSAAKDIKYTGFRGKKVKKIKIFGKVYKPKLSRLF